MRIPRLIMRIGAAALVLTALAGCGGDDTYTYETVPFDQLPPEQQEQARRLAEEAERAVAAGEPLPPEMITEEMLTSGRLVDGVLVSPEQ